MHTVCLGSPHPNNNEFFLEEDIDENLIFTENENHIFTEIVNDDLFGKEIQKIAQNCLDNGSETNKKLVLQKLKEKSQFYKVTKSDHKSNQKKIEGFIDKLITLQSNEVCNEIVQDGLFSKEIQKIALSCLVNKDEITPLINKLTVECSFCYNSKSEIKSKKSKIDRLIIKIAEIKLNKIIILEAGRSNENYESAIEDIALLRKRYKNFVDRECSNGKYESAIKILEESFLPFSKNPLDKEYYYGECGRLYILMGKLKTAEKFLNKQKAYMAKISLEKNEVSSNEIEYLTRKAWMNENSPYTSMTLKDNNKVEELKIVLYDQLNSVSISNFDRCNTYYKLGKIKFGEGSFNNAIKHLNEALKLCNDTQLKMEILEEIGDCYQHLRNDLIAIEFYQKAEKNARELNNLHAIATYLLNMGFCNYRLLLKMDSIRSDKGLDPTREGKIKAIENQFIEALELFSQIESNFDKPEHQVNFFNVHDSAYITYENFLYEENRKEEALKIAQSRRARGLKAFIEKKHSSILGPSAILTPKEMQNLAAEFNTNFIVYSLAPLQYSLNNTPRARLWVISPEKIDSIEFPISQLLKEIEDFPDKMKDVVVYLRLNVKNSLEEIKKEMDYDATISDLTVDHLIDDPKHMQTIGNHSKIQPSSRSALETHLNALKKKIGEINNQLETWYQTLIPNELLDALPKGGETSLTIVPERELARVPFAALRYNKDNVKRYLIEDYPISIAPSVDTLNLLNILKKSVNPQDEGKGKSIAVYSNPRNDLEKGKKEMEEVATHLEDVSNATTMIGNKADRENFFINMNKEQYNYIHLVCHGTDQEAAEKDSIFKGALKFSSKSNTQGEYIYGDDIAKQNIHPELVFMSSCLSGKGKIHQEGNVGLVSAFLSAGAKSVISCHWVLFDSDLTITMVKEFYKSLFEGKSKTKALQEAMLAGLKGNVDRPDKWGLFLFSGLDGKVNVPSKIESNKLSKPYDSDFTMFDFF